MIKFLCIIGTRPEAIKMAPVILQLQKEDWAKICIVATAQHRDLLDQMLDLFKLSPDIDLNIMQFNQSLPDVTARLLRSIDKVLQQEPTDAVIVQGDTATTLATALCCFYRNIPLHHVEAGLRSHDLKDPFPEELNRMIADRVATLSFTPTETTKQNLLAEKIPEASIHITGNTVIDALYYIAEKKIPSDLNLDPQKRLIFVTVHRRESFGHPFLEICKAIRIIADTVPDIQILYPVHPNPNIAQIAHKELSNHPRIVLSAPLDYTTCVAVLQQCYLVLTDSGGIQEEAPAFGKPVLVLRDKTERTEGIEAGVARLVGRTHANIVKETLKLLNKRADYLAMTGIKCPYGDGFAANRIVKILKNFHLKK